MPVKLTQEQAEKNLHEFNNEYELISPYNGSTKPVMIRHNCGKEYKAGRYKSFLEGSNKCPVCYPSQSNVKGRSTSVITEDVMVQRLKDQLGDEYTYLEGFTIMAKTTSLMRHNTCGHEFVVAPKMMLGVKQTRCPQCSNDNRGSYLHDENYLQNLLDDKSYGHEYKWLEEYNHDNKEKLRIHHNKCNTEYLVRPNDFQQGYRCPKCFDTSNSYGRTIVNDFLINSNINFETEKKFDTLKHINHLRLDFYIPEKHLIIEYDGAQHFNNPFTGSKLIDTQNRDYIKSKWAIENNYNILRLHYKLKEEDLKLILDKSINGGLTVELIEKYNILVYFRKQKKVYNPETYYTKINEDYFKNVQDNNPK